MVEPESNTLNIQLFSSCENVWVPASLDQIRDSEGASISELEHSKAKDADGLDMFIKLLKDSLICPITPLINQTLTWSHNYPNLHL